jgi:hypothetical protein
MASYIGVSPPEQTGIVERYQFTGDGSTTVFSGNDNNGKEFRYISTNTLLVFLNGVQLVEDTDFTKTSNSQITFAVAPTAADELELLTFGSFDLNSPSTLRTDLGLELANGKILLGNSSGVSTQVTPSGDATLSNAGVITLADTYRIPGKLAGTNFTGSLLIGHSTTGTLNAATYNTGVGLGVLDALTSGDSNTALGHNALSTNTIGGGNTAIGRDALLSNNNGGDLTAVGFQALRLNSGSNSTAVGKNALVSNSTGSKNTALGVTALGSVAAGDGNIGIGYTSGNNITSGSGNVVIGVADVASATGDKQFKISDGEDGSVVWLTGDSSGNIGIKQTSPTAGLHIGGNGTDAGSFKVNAADNSEWFGVSAGTVSFNMQGGSTKVAGAQSLGARMNISQLNSGTAALALAGGQANNILEINSANSDLGGDYLVVDQNGKVGIGTTSPSQPLHVVGNILGTGTIEAANFKQGGTNFSESILIGQSIPGTISNASGNVGIGDDVFSVLTSGQNNVAMGNNAGAAIRGGYRNVIIGTDAGINMVAGPYNTVVGAFAGKTISSGEFNTFIGGKAGEFVSSGAGNVMIGFGAAPPNATGDQQLQISGNNNTGNAVNWIEGNSSGLVTMSGGISTPTITGLTSLTTENVNIDNNSITALSSSIEQVSYTSVTTNLSHYSEQLDNTYFTKSRSTISTNAGVAPDGTTTADKLIPNSGLQTASSVYLLRAVAGSTYNYSVYAKADGFNFVTVNFQTSGSGTTQGIRFNLSTGAIDTSQNANGTITDAGNGWYRCSMRPATTTTSVSHMIAANDGGSFGTFFNTPVTGDGTKGILLWGVQYEVGDLTGYLPTTSASLSGITGVTRGVSDTTAATASSGGVVTLGSTSTTLATAITATQTGIPLASLTGVAASGSAVIGTSNMDLNLSSSGTGSVTINQIKTNSVTGEVIPGKIGGTNFSNSLLIGHSTTGTLNSAGQNTGVGIQALDAITSGDANTAIGYGAGTNISSGTSNTAIGYKALLQNQVGGSNTALGHQAGQLVTGDWNVCIGKQSGDTITSGDGNVCIGPEVTVDNAAGDTQLKIGSMASGGGAEGTDVMWLSGDSSGNLTTTGDVTLANDKKVIFGDAGEHIVGDGTNLKITSSGFLALESTGTWKFNYSPNGGTMFSIVTDSSDMILRNESSDKDLILRGVDSGSYVDALTLDMSDAGTAIFNHDILPTTDATQDLGSTSKRWNNIYTGDLHLSNESTKSGNSIDGTKGNWTLQEGQSDLFLINNNTGKKYKFKIEEIE